MNTDAEFLEEAEDLFERHSFVIETGERVMLQSNLDKLIAAFAFQTAEDDPHRYAYAYNSHPPSSLRSPGVHWCSLTKLRSLSSRLHMHPTCRIVVWVGIVAVLLQRGATPACQGGCMREVRQH